MFYVRCRQGFFFSDVSNLAEEKRQGVNKKKKLGKKSASFLLCTLKPFYLSLEWEEVILPLFNSSPSRFEFPIVWEFPVSTLSHAGAKHSSGPSLHPCIDPVSLAPYFVSPLFLHPHFIFIASYICSWLPQAIKQNRVQFFLGSRRLFS